MRRSMIRAHRHRAVPGALCFAIALVVVPATAQSDTKGSPITMNIRDRSVAYGHGVVVTGHVYGAGPGTAVTLQHRPQGGQWQSLRDATTGANGRYRLVAPLPSGGDLRVVAGMAGAWTGGAQAAEAGAPPPVGSAVARVAVAADIIPGRRRVNVLAGRRALVRGAVRPAVAGRAVTLQRRAGHGWKTLAHRTTRAAGRFTFRFRPRRPLSAVLRVRAAGTPQVAATRETVGRLNVYRRAFVSWYGPGLFGQRLGCGGTLTPGTLGVANKALPCGTRVTLRNRGRTIRVRVIDRGPYVGGREFDLTSATKDRLGFGGVGSIMVTA
jgi:rare lipoprotein A